MGPIEKILDEALLFNKENVNDEKRKYCDVLIMGPTCGKSTIVREWLVEHRNDIKQCYWHADRDPGSARFMYTKTLQKEPCCPWIFNSKTIEDMNTPNTVLVLDNFNLTSDDIRAQMLSLVTGREVLLYNGEKKKLENGPLMVIAITSNNAEPEYREPDFTDEEISAFEKVLKLGYRVKRRII